MPVFNTPHKGSWGLPDFGITEAIGGLLGSPRTAQGGSNIIGGQRAQAPTPAPTRSVAGVSTGPASSVGGNTMAQLPSSGMSTGLGGGGGARAQSQPQSQGLNLQGVMEQTPQMPGIDFDALIAPALQGLDAAIGAAQGQSQANIQGIETQRAGDVARTNQSISEQQGVLEGSRTKQQGLAENAANEARRQYSEIQQGLQSRYGGTTGTGKFATEMAGTQTLKNIGNVRQALSDAMLQIDEKLTQVKEVGRIALQDIEDNARDAISKEKANLDSALAQIRQQRGELQSRKAELASQAIQLYQNTVNEVNARNAALKQQLFMQQQSVEQQLQLAMQKAGSVAKSYTPQDLVGLVQNAQPLVSAGFSPQFQGKLQGGGSFNISPTKQTEGEDDDEKGPF